MSRLKYQLGSVWTLYLVLFSWLGELALAVACTLRRSLAENAPEIHSGCLGLCPLILFLCALEPYLTRMPGLLAEQTPLPMLDNFRRPTRSTTASTRTQPSPQSTDSLYTIRFYEMCRVRYSPLSR